MKGLQGPPGKACKGTGGTLKEAKGGTDIIQGPKGDPGKQGETGDKGERGPSGNPGERGDKGASGPKGDKGDGGQNGPSVCTIKF